MSPRLNVTHEKYMPWERSKREISHCSCAIRFTCLIFCEILSRDSLKLDVARQSSASSSLFIGSSISNPLKAAAFLPAAFVLLRVKPLCVATRGVLTTNEESDLSFLLIGNEMEGTSSGASTFLLLKGKILDLTSLILWSGLCTSNVKSHGWSVFQWNAE